MRLAESFLLARLPPAAMPGSLVVFEVVYQGIQALPSPLIDYLGLAVASDEDTPNLSVTPSGNNVTGIQASPPNTAHIRHAMHTPWRSGQAYRIGAFSLLL